MYWCSCGVTFHLDPLPSTLYLCCNLRLRERFRRSVTQIQTQNPNICSICLIYWKIVVHTICVASAWFIGFFLYCQSVDNLVDNKTSCWHILNEAVMAIAFCTFPESVLTVWHFPQWAIESAPNRQKENLSFAFGAKHLHVNTQVYQEKELFPQMAVLVYSG